MPIVDFLAGSLWMSAFLLAMLVLGVASVEAELEEFLAILTVLTLGVMVFVFDSPSWTWVTEHPVQIILGLVGYVVVGVCWGVLKWRIHVRKRAPEVSSRYKQWKKDRSRSKDEGVHFTLEDYLSSYDNPLRLSSNKKRISIWMLWWPLSVFWTLTRGIFTDLREWVYRIISGKLNDIMVRAIKKGVDDDGNV